MYLWLIIMLPLQRLSKVCFRLSWVYTHTVLIQFPVLESASLAEMSLAMVDNKTLPVIYNRWILKKLLLPLD